MRRGEERGSDREESCNGLELRSPDVRTDFPPDPLPLHGLESLCLPVTDYSELGLTILNYD